MYISIEFPERVDPADIEEWSWIGAPVPDPPLLPNGKPNIPAMAAKEFLDQLLDRNNPVYLKRKTETWIAYMGRTAEYQDDARRKREAWKPIQATLNVVFLWATVLSIVAGCALIYNADALKPTPPPGPASAQELFQYIHKGGKLSTHPYN
jgi:hypothetical protein